MFGTRGDRPEHPANIHKRVLIPARERAGMRRYSLHSLRHHAISRWLATGLDLKLVPPLAGHATMTMTPDRCGHLIPRHDHHALVAGVEPAG